MQIVYRFELEPTPDQTQKLFGILKHCRKLYNWALEQRQTTYKKTGKGLTYNQQATKGLATYLAQVPECEGVHSQVRQDVLKRLDTAYQRFFEKKAGYPHFKGRDHYTSFTYPQVDAVQKTFQEEGFIYLSGIGFVKFKAHRDFPADQIKRANIKWHGGKWYVNLTAELEPAKPVVSEPRWVGVDRGLTQFAKYSDGTTIINPRYMQKAEQQLAKLQQRLSRKQRGSKNRQKAKAKLAKAHAKIANQRRDFLHKVSHDLVTQYDVIVMEDLKIKNMLRNHNLAKSIQDASWGKLSDFADYKAKKFGKVYLKVNPAGTSQECVCGYPVPKALADRYHICPNCGLEGDRDWVSAQVIENRGRAILRATA